MALSRVSSGITTSFTGSYVAGDLLVIHAINTGGAATPLLPTGYTSISSATSSFGMAAFYKFATSASETFPTITNRTASSWAIYRGAAATPFVGTVGANGVSSTVTYSGLTIQNPNVDWVLTFGAANTSAGALGSHPSTKTTLVVEDIASNYEVAIFDSNGPVTSFSFNTKPLSASTSWLTKTTELVAGPDVPVGPATPTNLFFEMF